MWERSVSARAGIVPPGRRAPSGSTLDTSSTCMTPQVAASHHSLAMSLMAASVRLITGCLLMSECERPSRRGGVCLANGRELG
jgi:hypothetical protein